MRAVAGRGAERVLGAIGRRGLRLAEGLHEAARLINEAARLLGRAPFTERGFRWPSAVRQIVLIGVNSVPIVALIALSVGMIIALQAAYQLRRFGAMSYVADLVGVTISRELGPLMAAIILAGRSGSAIAAELGTMKVGEEIDALNAIGLSPVQFLVVPRVIAMAVVLPCLSVLADVAGILGGMAVGAFVLSISPASYLAATARSMVLKDIFTGLIKSLAFALIIVGVGCFQGFRVEGGAEGVGRRTTASVVVSVTLVILADLFFTAAFYFFT